MLRRDRANGRRFLSILHPHAVDQHVFPFGLLRVFADLELNTRVSVQLGGFGNQRFGSDRAFEQARPVISLTVRGRRSSFVFGALPALTPSAPAGPDRGGPHALLPPLQRETLSFDRPYEAGLEWDFTGARLRHSIWLEWQRLNTPEHRERFDGGLRGELVASRGCRCRCRSTSCTRRAALLDRSRGRQRARRRVGSRSAAGPRASIASLEMYGLAARSVPDRQKPDEDRNGVAFGAPPPRQDRGARTSSPGAAAPSSRTRGSELSVDPPRRTALWGFGTTRKPD